jgi:DNA polymerase-3 subunit gamma/tau
LSKPAGVYRVLARTYRPQRFSELIGQEALVRTLGNALATGRIAHAFLLTGIRGVGKTTTARIIARALNCVGPDGKGAPTPEPCGQCDPCVAIAEGRHIDVLEMDAATHTGIDDVRELVDSVRYAPTAARCKVYIIDEVHMLSEKAFNGLLKTLEEPPPQTLFIFATTEVRKIPVTVLSRCQRFDLRRIEGEQLVRHFAGIAEREEVAIEPAALHLIARAAQGSVRDGLSLLDQAIALASGSAITAAQVQDMLGLADRDRVLGLFERIMRGEVPGALAELGDLYERGSEPDAVVGDLLEISHWLTRLKVAPSEDDGIAAWDLARGRALAQGLSLALLARAWQMLLKGLDELRIAPSPLLAAEMLIVRLAHAASLPPIERLAGLLDGQGEPGGAPRAAAAPATEAAPAQPVAAPPPIASAERNGAAPPATAAPQANGHANGTAAPAEPPAALAMPASFAAVAELCQSRGKPMLYAWLYQEARMVAFAPGRITLARCSFMFANRRPELIEGLRAWTGRTWQVEEADQPGGPTLAEQASEQRRQRLASLAEDPRLQPVFEQFPDARIVDVRTVRPPAEPLP